MITRSVQRGALAQQRSVAMEQDYDRASNVHREQWHRGRSDNAPHYQGVPLPLPDVANKPPWMVAEKLDLMSAERKFAGVK